MKFYIKLIIIQTLLRIRIKVKQVWMDLDDSMLVVSGQSQSLCYNYYLTKNGSKLNKNIYPFEGISIHWTKQELRMLCKNHIPKSLQWWTKFIVAYVNICSIGIFFNVYSVKIKLRNLTPTRYSRIVCWLIFYKNQYNLYFGESLYKNVNLSIITNHIYLAWARLCTFVWSSPK